MAGPKGPSRHRPAGAQFAQLTTCLGAQMSSGLFDAGRLYLKYDEDVQAGRPRLGRNLWLDRRSLAHMVENDVAAMGHHLRNTSWERVLPVLDQGHLGSCTGNAGTGALGTQPFYDAVGAPVLPADAAAGEKFAV